MVLQLRSFHERMADQGRRIVAAVEALEAVSASYALVGGHAVSFYVRPRVTVDEHFGRISGLALHRPGD